MKFRTTLILVLIAAALAVYFFAVERHRPTTDERREAEAKVFAGEEFVAGFGADRKTLSQLVTKLTLQQTEPPQNIVLEKQKDGEWRITQPHALRAEKTTVESVLYALEGLRRKNTIRPDAGAKLDLAKYGLDKPRATAIFNISRPGSASKEWTLLVGNKTPDNKNSFVKRADEDTVMVVEASSLDRLTLGVNDLRDKVVLAVKPDDTERLELKHLDGGHIRLDRKDKVWHLTTPVADFADPNEVRNILDKLAGMRLAKEDFVTEDDSDLRKYGLDEPRLVVEVYEAGQGKTLLVGKAHAEKSDKVYAKRAQEPSIFTLDTRDTTSLSKQVRDLRLKRALVFATDDVERLTLETPGGPVALRTKERDWEMEQPSTRTADRARVDEFLRALERLEIEEWADEAQPDLAKYGLEKPMATITLNLKKGEVRVLKIGGTAKDVSRLYARRGDSGPILTVKADFLRHALKGYLAFISRQIISFGRNDLERLVIERPDGMVAIHKSGDQWRLDKPIVGNADKSTMDDLLWDLSFLQAEEYIAEKPPDLAPYGLDKPHMTVTLEYQKEIKDVGGAPTKTAEGSKQEDKPTKQKITQILLIGKVHEGENRYAKLADGDLVFTLGKTLIKRLGSEFASREVCKFSRDDVTAIVLEYPDKKVRMEKKEGRWLVTVPEEKPAAADTINDLLSTASQLRAQEVAAHAVDDPAKYGLDKPNLVLTIYLGKESRKLTIGALREGTHYVTTADSPLLFRVSEHDVARLMQEKPTSPPPPPAPPAATNAPKLPQETPAETPKAETPK